MVLFEGILLSLYFKVLPIVDYLLFFWMLNYKLTLSKSITQKSKMKFLSSTSCLTPPGYPFPHPCKYSPSSFVQWAICQNRSSSGFTLFLYVNFYAILSILVKPLLSSFGIRNVLASKTCKLCTDSFNKEYICPTGKF